MATSFFGQYVVRKGIVNRTQLQEAIALQRNANQTLAQISLSAGALTSQQLQALPLSLRQNDALFQYLIIYLGWISGAELAALRTQHRKAQLTLGETLVKCGYLNNKSLPNLLTDYHYWNLRNLQQFGAGVSASEFSHTVDSFSFLLTREMLQVYGLHVKPDSASRKPLSNTSAWHWEIDFSDSCLNLVIPHVEGGVARLLDYAAVIDSLDLTKLSHVHQADLLETLTPTAPIQFFADLLQLLLADVDAATMRQTNVSGITEANNGTAVKECLRCGYSLEGEPFYVYFYTS